LLARSAEVGATGRAVGRAGEASVASPAPRSPRHQHALAVTGEISQPLASIALEHHGAEGNAKHSVGSAPAVLVGALTVLAAFGRVVTLIVKVEQRGDGVIGFKEDVAAVTPVTPVRPAPRDELLAPEAYAPGPSVAALDEDIDLVNEHLGARKGRR